MHSTNVEKVFLLPCQPKHTAMVSGGWDGTAGIAVPAMLDAHGTRFQVQSHTKEITHMLVSCGTLVTASLDGQVIAWVGIDIRAGEAFDPYDLGSNRGVRRICIMVDAPITALCWLTPGSLATCVNVKSSAGVYAKLIQL